MNRKTSLEIADGESEDEDDDEYDEEANPMQSDRSSSRGSGLAAWFSGSGGLQNKSRQNTMTSRRGTPLTEHMHDLDNGIVLSTDTDNQGPAVAEKRQSEGGSVNQ